MANFRGQPDVSAIQQLLSSYGGSVTDPYFSSVVSLLNFPGADGSTTFTDVKGKVWTANGDAQIDTSLGYNTGLFQGSDDWISTPHGLDWQFGSGEFTFDGIVRFNNYPVNNGGFYQSLIIAKQSSGVGQFSFRLAAVGTAASFTALELVVFTNNTTSVTCVGTFAFALNTNYHIEACRDVNTLRVYVDGVQVGTAAYSGTIQATAANIKVGSLQFDATLKFDLNGHLRALRTTKGVCRHPGGTSFTPPSAPFPTS